MKTRYTILIGVALIAIALVEQYRLSKSEKYTRVQLPVEYKELIIKGETVYICKNGLEPPVPCIKKIIPVRTAMSEINNRIPNTSLDAGLSTSIAYMGTVFNTYTMINPYLARFTNLASEYIVFTNVIDKKVTAIETETELLIKID